jgi:hypothetical protein
VSINSTTVLKRFQLLTLLRYRFDRFLTGLSS